MRFRKFNNEKICVKHFYCDVCKKLTSVPTKYIHMTKVCRNCYIENYSE